MAHDDEHRPDEHGNDSDGAGHELPEGPEWTRRNEDARSVDADDSRSGDHVLGDVPDADRYDPDVYEAEETEHTGRGRLGEMGFFEHLEELRWRLIKALIALVVCSTVCGIFYNWIIEEVLLRPSKEAGIKDMINTAPMGQLMLIFQATLYSGLILSIPFIIWQLWAFVKPGLYPRERRYTGALAIATIGCFLIGLCFAYFVLLPVSLEFMYNIQFGNIRNMFSIAEYLSMVLGMLLACGVVFEMPVLSYGLARFGVLTAKVMKHYRRHAAVLILIVAAIITPTPDPFNQLLLAIPLYLLYEISIYVAVLAGRQRAEAQLGDA